MIVGVLAIQGDVPEHLAALARLGPEVEGRRVRSAAELAGLDALLMPGGESTTMAKLLREGGLWEPLGRALAGGLPVLGTCAGMILLARKVESETPGEEPATFGRLDVTVRRNDYGRQRESFEAPIRLDGLAGAPFPGVFIRAPRIVQVGPGAQSVAFRGHEVVGVRAGPSWGLAFHPELSGDDRVLELFLESARQTKRTRNTATKVSARPTNANVR